MKKLSKKALIGIFAAVLMAATGSISAFAALTYPGHPYSVAAGSSSKPIYYQADDKYMNFNTRPTAGAGGVYVSVSGPGGMSWPKNFFPFQAGRPALQINTSENVGNYYTVYLTAGSTDVSGVLSVWTSAN